jgi:hypothetical protein
MKNRLILLTVLGVALAGGTYVRAQFGDKPAKLDVVKLKDDLFVIHNDYVPGNTTVMVTNEGLILGGRQVRDRSREHPGGAEEDQQPAGEVRDQHPPSRRP